jgi:uncharacterized protein YkwD
MSRVRTVALLAMLASLIALPGVASASQAQSRVFEKVNKIRAKHGLAPLHFSGSLSHSADRYSHRLMSSGSFGHSSRIHASHRFRTLGEVLQIHRGRPKARWAVRSWLHSPSHRSILLSSRFRFAGAGVSSGRWHGRRATIWVMHFGAGRRGK